MRLYQGRIGPIAADITRTLIEAGDIEASSAKDVEADVASVLRSYLEAEKDVTEKAKDLMQARGLAPNELQRIKRLVADQRGIKLGDEMLDYLLDQLVQMLMHSNNVEEVFAEDVAMRRKMALVLKREMAVDEELDRETRAKIKHVQEGTRTWEVEYRRVMEEIRRRKGL